MSARDAVIVDAVRTPVGKRNGSLAKFHAVDLSAHVLNALVARNGFDPAVVDDVIWGCVQQVGQQAGNVGRMAVLAAGWPESVPGTTVDRQCGSSQQTIHFAAAGLVSGLYDVAIAGGVEMMSAVPLGAMAMFKDLGRPGGQKVRERYGVTFNQGIGAEMMAEKWGLSRGQLDEFSSASHAKLAAATDEGRLAGQIAPVELPDGQVLSADEGLRRGTSPEKLAGLKPARVSELEASTRLMRALLEEGAPDFLRKAEVGGVIAVQVTDLPAAHHERELAPPAGSRHYARPGRKLIGDPVARPLFNRHDYLLPCSLGVNRTKVLVKVSLKSSFPGS